MNLDLTGKSALVCGSTAGIGKAIAKELAEMGASLVLMARNEEKLKTAVSEMDNSKGQQHSYVVADFSDVSTVKTAVESIQNPIHILINNTGGPPGGPIIDADVREFVSAFSMHLLCNHTLVQGVKQGMIDSGYGRIINIISTSVKIPLTGLGVSNTVRGAVGNWAKTMANELGVHGITVNNVLPGATATERLTSIVGNKAQKSGKSEDEIMAQFENAVPMKRIAEPHEVAAAAAFLASPAASYINGINVPVDGGRTGSL
ncbi:MAG: SDR family oxidoreductase [Vicingaceae bacterium]|jgi:3-oxoacyl-[acyl-carrier protein] reductase|tara:strand:+ start:4400 stop:5179 length:780 start_codon:yes stop_codon:yes gene_type:complete